MSGINEGIKQPLRFYDSVDKQNFRREWIHDSGLVNQKKQGGVNVVINPINTIIPFQIRRRKNPNPVTVFDLYAYDTVSETFIYDQNLITNIVGTFSDNMRIVQTQVADNIIWQPRESFINNLPCGLYYVVVSDGITTWYSEVFEVIAGLDTTEYKVCTISKPGEHITTTTQVGWDFGGDHYILTLGKKTV